VADNYTRVQRARVLSGQTDSEPFQAEDFRVFGVVVPATIDGTQIRFKVSHDNVTFVDLYDNAGAQVTITVAANRGVQAPAALEAWKFFKVVQVTSATANRDYYVCGKS